MSRRVGLGWRGWFLALLLIGVVEGFYVSVSLADCLADCPANCLALCL